MKTIPWFGRILVTGLACACLAGCFGKPPPVERYLRVRIDNPPCQGETVEQRLPLGMKPLKALENLDRTTVMTARDQVLTPSLQFYWEGAPQDIVGQILRQAIECQSKTMMPVDYQPRVDHAAVLTGQLTAFNVEETEGGRFVVSLHLDLWTKNSGARVATGDFNAYFPLEDFQGPTVAKAASNALGRVVPKVIDWLDVSLPRVEKANKQQQQ